MGSAIIRGGFRAAILEPSDVSVAESDDQRRQAMADLGCVTTADPKLVADADQLMLAVKPQVFPRIAKLLKPLEKPAIVISVMAGLSSSVIRQALGTNARVIRVMPNTPCRIGAGMSAIAIGEGATESDAALTTQLMQSLGKVIEVEEQHMHAVTAISGSGPAYVFLLAEAMEQAGQQVGLSERVARTLAYQTILGAGQLLTSDDDETADALRTAVTSPSGTTAAALEVMFKREFPQIITEAVLAARDRSMDLGRAND